MSSIRSLADYIALVQVTRYLKRGDFHASRKIIDLKAELSSCSPASQHTQAEVKDVCNAVRLGLRDLDGELAKLGTELSTSNEEEVNNECQALHEAFKTFSGSASVVVKELESKISLVDDNIAKMMAYVGEKAEEKGSLNPEEVFLVLWQFSLQYESSINRVRKSLEDE